MIRITNLLRGEQVQIQDQEAEKLIDSDDHKDNLENTKELKENINSEILLDLKENMTEIKENIKEIKENIEESIETDLKEIK